jgi:hypothetical protein
MKRLISAVLGLTLLGTAAASAQPFYGNRGGHDSYRGYDRGYHDTYRGDYRGYRRHNDGGALIGLGIGLMALAAIASSQHHDRDYHNDYRGGYNGYGR